MPEVKIVEYNDLYREQIVALILGIQVNEFSIPISIEDQPDFLQISSFYQRGNGNFWVALADDKVIGTIAIIDIGNAQVALRKMFVAKSYRGKEYSVAQRLLRVLLTWCKNKAVREIYLGTTAAYLAAQRFYEKNGFEEIQRQALPATFSIMQVDSKFYRYRLS